MSAIAKEHNAVNLSQGFPDFEISSTLKNLVNEAVQQGFNQYAPMQGMPVLREAISEKIKKLYNANVNAETEITITPGGTYAIYNAFATILKPGDEAIVLEPCYDSYVPNIESCGAKAITVPLQFPSFSINWDLVKEAITSKTKAIIINSPHNPTGYTFTKEDIKTLDELTQNTNITIISDEVYEHITFDGVEHESILKYPSLYNRSFVIFSFGKVYHATGWKMGYCVAPPHLTSEFRQVHQYLCFSCNTSMQVAIANFMQYKNEYLNLPVFYEQKRNLFLAAMQQSKFIIHQKTQGSYFQLLDYSNISSLPDKEFAIEVTKKYGVATIPVSAFYQQAKDDKLIRVCFAKKDETMNAACKLLCAI
jgi:methionine aminotransferase